MNGGRGKYLSVTIPVKNILEIFAEPIDKHLCVAYNIDGRRWEVKSLQTEEKRTAGIFKALSDENRIRILKLLQNGEKCACVLLDDLKITQPTMSHHMKILCDSDLVVGRKEGKWIYYSISSDGASAAIKCLQELTGTNNTDTDKSCCEK